MSGKKFAVLLCAVDTEYVKKKYGGYLGVFMRMLAEDGETWDLYTVAAGNFPEDNKIAQYDGFVITGSCSDAHSNEIWICKLMNLIKKFDSMKKKVLGICFGHQILGRALGGKTGRAVSGWELGVTSIHLSLSSKMLASLKMPVVMPVIECHQDEVWELPPKAEVVAWSEKTGIEIFRYGDHIMGIQGHPEYTKDILLDIIERLLQFNFIKDVDAEKAKATLEAVEPDREAWKKLCISFLKSGL